MILGTRPAWSVAGGVAAVGMLVAACGSSTSSNANSASSATTGTSSSSSASSSGPTSFPSSASSSSSTTSRLQAIVVQQGDLPAGWVAVPADPSSGSGTGGAALAACVGAKDTDPDQTGKASSQTFTSGTSRITSEADAFRSEQDVQADAALLTNPKLQACAEQQLKTQLASSASGGTVNNVQVKVTPGANGGPSNLAGTLTVAAQVTAASGSGTVYLDEALITGPQIEASVGFVGVNARVPVAVETAVITAVAKRAAAG